MKNKINEYLEKEEQFLNYFVEMAHIIEDKKIFCHCLIGEYISLFPTVGDDILAHSDKHKDFIGGLCSLTDSSNSLWSFYFDEDNMDGTLSFMLGNSPLREFTTEITDYYCREYSGMLDLSREKLKSKPIPMLGDSKPKPRETMVNYGAVTVGNKTLDYSGTKGKIIDMGTLGELGKRGYEVSDFDNLDFDIDTLCVIVNLDEDPEDVFVTYVYGFEGAWVPS